MPAADADEVLHIKAPLNRARQTLYRSASIAFSDPRSGSWQSLARPDNQMLVHVAAELIRSEAAPAQHALAPGEGPLERLNPAKALQRLPASADQFHAEFEATFGLLVTGGCPPNETEYVHGKLDFQRAQHLADVNGYYRAFGLKRANGHPERPDHIALELEFMAVVIGLELVAAEPPLFDAERVAICRNAQKRFLRDHLAWWTPAFAELLRRQDADGFYAVWGDLLAAFIPAERMLLGVDVPPAPAQPARMEPPDTCDGCPLSP